jgi:hypothetical protein
MYSPANLWRFVILDQRCLVQFHAIVVIKPRFHEGDHGWSHRAWSGLDLCSCDLGSAERMHDTVLRNPRPVIPASQEIDLIRQSLTDPGFMERAGASKPERNAYISERMYAIDLEYTNYEAALTHSTQEGTLGAALINLGITGTTSVLNVPETNKILSAIATGVTGASQAFDKDVLLSEAIQDLQTQMRADRNTQGARILANMNCSIKQYPLGRALSDLEFVLSGWHYCECPDYASEDTKQR